MSDPLRVLVTSSIPAQAVKAQVPVLLRLPVATRRCATATSDHHRGDSEHQQSRTTTSSRLAEASCGCCNFEQARLRVGGRLSRVGQLPEHCLVTATPQCAPTVPPHLVSRNIWRWMNLSIPIQCCMLRLPLSKIIFQVASAQAILASHRDFNDPSAKKPRIATVNLRVIRQQINWSPSYHWVPGTATWVEFGLPLALEFHY